MENEKADKIKNIVKKAYSKIASDGGGCGCSNCDCSGAEAIDTSKEIGYSDEEINLVPGANLGLGCGNPTALGKIKEGDVVLDLGSGAGLDCFIASKKVGSSGRVIGIDMTEEMVEKAKENAKKHNYKNVEFRLGDIENLPVDDNFVDVIISNCVINLVSDKSKVFREAYRALKEGGRMYVSDIVLLKELSEEQRNDEDLLSGCVAGALLREDYLDKIKSTGFNNVNVLSENEVIIKEQYQGIFLESLGVEAIK